jgi:hypothetical protein
MRSPHSAGQILILFAASKGCLAMIERRQLRRTRIRHHGKIATSSEATITDCTVVNITGNGICLELVKAIDIVPTAIDFSFDNFRTLRVCDVVWHRDNYIGASFRNDASGQVVALQTRRRNLIAVK